MDRNAVETALKRLRDEHARSHYHDPQSQVRTEQLIADLERELRHPEDSTLEELRQRLTDAIREFEVEHPKLTAALGQITSALSGMGI